jgi:nicotinamidase-related amidase
LGRTVPTLLEKIDKSLIYEKTRFSMCTPGVLENMEKISPSTVYLTLSFLGIIILPAVDYQSVLLCGIEAHACILSTALDLLEAGKDVHVIVDAVSSRSLSDR